MKHLSIAVLLALFLTLCAGCSGFGDDTRRAAAKPSRTAAAGGSLPGGDHLLRMKMAQVIDRQGFEKPMPAAMMLVPLDWSSDGATTWNPKDNCNIVQTTLRAQGPDGRAIEIIPVYNWSWADDPRPLQMAAAQRAQFGMRGCDVIPPMKAADYLRRNLGRWRPGAQVSAIEPAPRLAGKLQEHARQIEQMGRQYGLQQRVTPDAVRARLRYSLNGRPVEEWLYVVTSSTATLGPSMNLQTMQMTQAYTYNCLGYAVAVRAPEGKLDASERFFELIAGTYQTGPEWQQHYNQAMMKLQQIESKGIRDRSAIVARNAQDIARIRNEAWQNRQRSQDRNSEQWSQTMRGVESYRNPTTGDTVELNGGYGNAWVNNRGEYLLSDQPGFDPSVTLREDWKPLERLRP